MSAELVFVKALRVLDRGDAGRGEVLLRAAAGAGDGITAVAALCCLGELLIQQGRPDEAAEALRGCLDVAVPEELDDACAAERARARELLAGLG